MFKKIFSVLFFVILLQVDIECANIKENGVNQTVALTLLDKLKLAFSNQTLINKSHSDCIGITVIGSDCDIQKLNLSTEEVFIDSNESTAFYDSYENDTYENDTLTPEVELEMLWRNHIFPKAWTWVLIVFHAAVFFIGLLGNTLVCIAVYRNHSMRTVTNYFIVNLALADFLVILFCLPPTVVWDVTMTWFFGLAMCKIVLYLQFVSVYVSVLTLTFISLDRWYAICFPLRFKSTTGRAQVCIGIIWVFALTAAAPELYATTYQKIPLPLQSIYFTTCKAGWSREADHIYSVVKMVLFYIIPLLFMTIAYAQIIRILWKSGSNLRHTPGKDVSKRNQGNSFAMNMNASTEGQLRSRKKAAKMLVAVVIMFAFCFLPLHMLTVLKNGLTDYDVHKALSLISHWLCYANSAINPIIYNFMSGKFRREFRSSFTKCRSKEQSEMTGRTSTYIYRFTTNHQSARSRCAETIPLNNIHTKKT